jgi:hypothetical protein
MQRRILTLLASFGLLFTAGFTMAGEQAENDGTDPTLPVRKAWFAFEHLELDPSGNSNMFSATFDLPLGSAKAPVLRVKVPVAAIDIAGDNSYGLSDVQVRLTKVMSRTREGGLVLFGEIFFDTAERPELGTGKTVARASAIYAKFLSGGRIFAPAVLHNFSVAGDDDRDEVSITTFDFYYVPRFSNPKVYMTVDPFITLNWENDRQFAGLAVTTGYKLGKMLGGRGQAYVKPTVFLMSEKPSSWGLEVGFQLLGW